MEALFSAMLQALNRGEDLVLCSIIASSGSTPRGRGAKMAVFADGSTLGTVGGGAVEYHSTLLAREALAQRRTFSHGFNLTPNQTADIGMICGGQVDVYFQFFSGEDLQAKGLLKHIVSLFPLRQNTWLVTEIAEGGARRMGVFAADTALCFDSGIPPEQIAPLAQPRGILSRGEPAYYVEPLTTAGFVYVFGGGHVSQELVPVIAHVGFSVILYEERAEFATEALFPTAVETVVAPYDEASERLAMTADDFVIIMTRGHQSDFTVLRQALRTPACYVGVIGSRHKVAATNQRLLADGIAEAELKRIHSPIGLPIKAETPAEIAVSIAAELILHRAARTGVDA